MHPLAHTLAVFALSAPALAGPNCNILDIPDCIGWKVTCPSHAPSFSLDFTTAGLELRYLTGPNFNTPTTTTTPFTSTVTQVGGQPQSSFTTALGLEGRITRLDQPTCSDGHFLDGQQFELTITNPAPNIAIPTNTSQPSFRVCCTIQPH